MTPNRVASRIRQFLGAAVLALAAQTAQATPAWQINPSGLGAAGATPVSLLEAGGVGFVQLVPTSPSTFSFIEHGAYRAVLGGSQEITVTYAVSGSGDFANPFALRFNSGIINLYADPNFDFASSAGTYGADNGTSLGHFDVLDGGVMSNGLVRMLARLDTGTLHAGYLFDAAGNDLSTARNVQLELSIFNQQTTPDALLVSEIICQMSGFAGPGCNGEPFQNSPMAFAVNDGALLSLATVPEPATPALLLGGLGLLPWLRRRPIRRA